MTAYSKWASAWLGAPIIGVVNGALRQALYTNRLGELRAHQVSTVTCIAGLVAYVRAVDRRWPIADARRPPSHTATAMRRIARRCRSRGFGRC